MEQGRAGVVDSWYAGPSVMPYGTAGGVQVVLLFHASKSSVSIRIMMSWVAVIPLCRVFGQPQPDIVCVNQYFVRKYSQTH